MFILRPQEYIVVLKAGKGAKRMRSRPMDTRDRLLMIRILSRINDERFKGTARSAGLTDRSHFRRKDENK